MGMSAARWKTMSMSRVRPRQKWGSRMSPVTTSIWEMDGKSSSHPPVIKRVVLAQGQDASALFHQGLGQVRTDETVGARYQNSFPLQQYVSPRPFTKRVHAKSGPLVRPLAIRRPSPVNAIRYLPPIECRGAFHPSPSCVEQFYSMSIPEQVSGEPCALCLRLCEPAPADVPRAFDKIAHRFAWAHPARTSTSAPNGKVTGVATRKPPVARRKPSKRGELLDG